MNRRFFAASFGLIAMLFVSTASAEDTPLKPVIEIGSGIESGVISGGVNVLLRVGFHVQQDRLQGRLGPAISERLYWARIKGDVAIADGSNGSRVPYFEFEFTPVQNQIALFGPDRRTFTQELRVLPSSVERNIRLNEELAVTVSTVGMELGLLQAKSDDLLIFAQIAADTLGYKMASYVSGDRTFQGFRMGGLGLETGVIWILNQTMIAHLVAGTEGDLSVGNQWAFQSDMEAYAAIKLDITRFLQVFLSAGWKLACDSGLSRCWNSPEVMAGASVLF